jgi:hypothetical protein
VVGEGPALPAALDGLERHLLERPQAGVPGIVQQHGDVFVEVLGKVEADLDVLGDLGVGIFDPGDAADHIGAKLERLAQQLRGAGLARDAVLGEGRDLDVDDALEFPAHRQQRLHALQPRLAVDVRQGPDVKVAVIGRQGHRAPGVVGDPGRLVVRLDDSIIGRVQTLHRWR